MGSFGLWLALTSFFRYIHCSTRPNILFVLVDDLGWNDVSFHGGSDFETPNLDELAANSVRLNNYYVQHYCTPTRSALMSGRYPMRDGLQEYVIRSMAPYGMPLDIITLPEELQSAGYSTHLLGKWHLGFFDPDYLPNARGFDTFMGYYGDKEEYYMKNNSEWAYVSDKNTMVRMSGYDFRVNNEAWVSDDYSSYLYGNETIHMFMEHAASTDPEPDPLFILYSAQAAHIPYDAPDEYMERFSYIEDEDRQGLAAVIAVFDESLGDIVEYLKSEDSGFLWENTLMIISTDNGGTVTSGSSNFPLRGGKKTLWEGGIRATAFVTGGWLPEERLGQDMDALMHVTDWLPTLLSIAGTVPSAEVDGYDQSDNLINGEDDVYSPREEILLNVNYHQVTQSDNVSSACYNDFCGAIRWRDYKLVIGSNDQMRFSDESTILCVNGWCDNADTGSSVSSHSVQCSSEGDNYAYPELAGDGCLYNGAACLFNIVDDPCEWTDIGGTEEDIFNALHDKIAGYNVTQVKSLYREHPENPIDADPSKFDNFWSPWENVDALETETETESDTETETEAETEIFVVTETETETETFVVNEASVGGNLVLSIDSNVMAIFVVALVSMLALYICWQSEREYMKIDDARSVV